MLTWVLLTLFLGLVFWTFRKPSGLPPGRWGLPVIGYFPLYTKNIGKIISDLRKKYGDMFTWKLGGHTIVVFCDYKLIKHVFNRPECQGRPYLYTFEVAKYFTNSGIIGSVGDAWADGRRFALRTLKDFGMGKSSIESVIQYEAQNFTTNFEKTSGTPVEISWNLNVAVLNVIWKLVADQRYDINDKEVLKFSEMLNETLELSNGRCAPLDIFPGLDKILPDFILNDWFKVNRLKESMDKFKELFMELIKEHEKTFDPNNQRDYIDAYLAEIQKEKGNPNSIFKEEYLNLVVTISDLFAAGSETTSSTIRWLVALMAVNPEIQTKMQKEIDAVVHRDQRPSLQDKEKLPYTEAVLYEVLRYSCLIPNGVLHETTEEIQVGDYRLPKNTALLPSVRSCHMDPKYFERPDEFYPEHFLDDQGKVNTRKEGFLPFSLGRRQCLGESLAKMELFLFSTTLFQRFSVAPPKGAHFTPTGDPSQLFFNFIQPYEIVFTKRN